MQLLLIILITLFGALVRSVFGFGEALVTMPLLALIGLPLPTATALIGAVGFLVALPATIRYRANIDWPTILRLLAGSLIGISFGIYLVKTVPTKLVLSALGIFLIIYGSYSLYRSFHHEIKGAHLKNSGWDFIAGFVSGTLGSAYNSHGVPVAVYGTLKKWPAAKLRGILQAHFLIVGLLVVISHITAGFWSLAAFKLLLYAAPGLIVTVILGNYIVDHIAPEKLIKYIYAMLILFGVLLLFR